MKVSDELREYCKGLYKGGPNYMTLMAIADRIDSEMVELPRDPHELAPIRETKSGGVYCSCCGRQLRREYLVSPLWRFCPRCGAEVLR